MAFERNRATTLRFVAEEDSAIDRAASDYDAFVKDGACNWTHLKFIDGASPTVFEIGKMSARQRMRWNDLRNDNGATSSSAIQYVVRCTLRSVDNLGAPDGSGPMRAIEFEQEQDGRLVSRKWLDDADLPVKLLNDLHILGTLLSEARVPLA